MSDGLTWADSDGRYIYIIDPKKYFSFVRLKVSSEDGSDFFTTRDTTYIYPRLAEYEYDLLGSYEYEWSRLKKRHRECDVVNIMTLP